MNRYLTGMGKSIQPVSAIAYLDLNPLKQEFAPSGQVSLVVARDVNLSPSFAYPVRTSISPNTNTSGVIRSHPMPSDIAGCAGYYQACVDDLILAFKKLSSREAYLSLIIDIPGDLYTRNFEGLEMLLACVKPHHLVYVGDSSASNIEDSVKIKALQSYASQYRSSFHSICPRSPTSQPLRTEIQMRSMQMQSYFHLLECGNQQDGFQELSWTIEPLSGFVPWEICYRETTQRKQDLVGFAMYGEPIESASLVSALNGSLVHVVQSTSSAIPHPYTALPRTNKVQLPYFPGMGPDGVLAEPLDPGTSMLICAALIRGFDHIKRVVHVLVPKLYEPLLYNLLPERTILVGGCCDMPGWVFQQERSGLERDEHIWLEKDTVVEDLGYLNTIRRVRKFQT